MWVYIHIFPNGKRYIGQTIAPVKTRWKSNGSGYSRQLVYKPIIKYGWDNIQHITYEVETKEEMDYLERYLIRYYNTTDKRFGYNIDSGGNKNKKFTKEHKDKISEANKGKHSCSEEHKIKISAANRKPKSDEWKEKVSLKNKGKGSKPIAQYSKEDTFIREWNSAGEAANELGIQRPNICNCLNGKLTSAGGFKWKYISVV